MVESTEMSQSISPRRVGCGLDQLEQAFPGPIGRPKPVAFIDGLPRPAPFGQVTRLNTGPHLVQNPVSITCR